MIKYVGASIVFQEVPDEIALALEISNCPHNCKNCHSQYLKNNDGKILDDAEMERLLQSYPYVTCVCLMGGDADHKGVAKIADYLQKKSIKSAMYSGDDVFDVVLSKHLDYYKVGSYIEEKGPLNSANTNQRMYKMRPKKEDITYKFRKDFYAN